VTTPAFTLLVPIKDTRDGKSRLGSVGDERRRSLMAAFARDALTAAGLSTLVTVYVVGDASTLDDVLDGLAVPVLPDRGDGSLNRALAHAAAEVAEPGRGVAALLADLPCLRHGDLDEALASTWHHGGRTFVADAEATGTTLLAACPGQALDPRFGAGSAQRHRESGATELTGDLASLRRDVDTTADLAAALRFGVGAFTAAATADLA
jgi:2-phospho-L-lactate guanylyltransferase